MPFKVVALDIETAHATAWAVQHDIEQAVSKVTRNKAKAFKTPEKQAEENERIEQEYLAKCEEAKAKVIEKSALSLAAPIACIGVVTDGKQFHFSSFEFSDGEILTLLQAGIYPFTFPDMRGMLNGFAWFLNTLCDASTQYVGHNSWNFDFSRLRLAYLREDLSIPPALVPANKQNCHDTMRMFQWFSGDMFTSLEAMCNALEIPFSKAMSGAEVPDAIANKEYLRVTLYNMPDAWACYRAFLKMQGV